MCRQITSSMTTPRPIHLNGTDLNVTLVDEATMRRAAAVFGLAALLSCTALAAQHAPAHEAASHHPNHVAAFGGVTVFHEEAFPTLGAEYTRRQPEWKNWGGTAFAELVFASEVEFLLGVTANYFVNRLVLEAGPGLLISHGTEFLFRIGGGYEIKSGPTTIMPKMFLDFIGGGTAFVFGVAIGRGF